MRLGIDASNIRIGGGVTHLKELLCAARPFDHGFSDVVVWGSSHTLHSLPKQAWLTMAHDPLLDRPLPWRLYWQTERLPGLAKRACDILFAPGGVCEGNFRPFVSMSQNLLPFEDRNTFSIGWHDFRLMSLRFLQTRCFKKADGVIFLTRYAYSEVMHWVKHLRGKTAIIPHGVNPRFFQPPRVQRSIQNYSRENPFRLLYVPFLEPYKHQSEWQKRFVT